MAKNKELDDIGKLSADLDEKIFGIGKSDSKELNKKEDLRDELSKLADNFHKGNGNSQGNLIELFATVSAKTSYSKGKMVAKDYKDKKEGLEKKLNNETLGYLNQMMMSEKERIMGYRNYTMIHAMIPQIAEAIKTYVDNIISPDDFTKNSFNFSLVGEESNNKTFDANINKLKELYNIEEKVAKYIEESLVNGDLFIFVEKMSDGLASVFLSEDNEDVMSLEKSGDALNIHDLTRTDIVLTEDVLNKIKGARTKDSKLSEAQEIAAFKKDVIAYVDEKFIVTSDTSHFFEDYNTLREDYQALSESTKIEQKNLTDIPLEGLNKTLGKKTKDDTDLSNIRGSIIKKLDPQRIIKLWADGFTYGYYYVDTAANSYMDSPRLKDAGSTFNSLFTLEGGGDGMMKNKQEYMFELLFQSVTKKINKKFVKDNPEFKEIIYNMMTQQELYNKKLKIIYIPPEKVVHFHPSQDNTVEYGKSLYKDVLFTAKLYLSVLISTLMMMLLRGADKRAWYVETGLENDQEAVINRTIQDVKGREIKLNDFGDIQHVLNLVGMFDDYFFPMFDGEKPLDMEIIEGQKMELDNNEFLEYLKKAAISGMGVPPAHLGYTEDIELAKSLTMMNGKFIRRVISLQAAYGTKINKFVRLLYINEFDTLKNDEARKDDAIFKINPKDIQVTLPSPATLNYTNLNELIGNSDSIINKIVDTLVSDQENAFDENISSDEVRFQFMKSVTKEMIPMIDWGKFETLLDETVKKIVKMTPNIEEDAGGDLGDEGLGDEDMGDEGLGDEDMGDEGLGDEDMGDEGLDSEKEQSSGDTDTDESPETDKGTNVDESPDSKEKK